MKKNILLKFLENNILYIVVFFTGAAVLIIEILATRILSPYFGSTIYSVSSILGVILAGLSIGYYYGGILADRKPEHGVFYLIILLSGFSVLALHLIKLSLLSILVNTFNIKSGPIVSSLLLFFIPAVLLGVLSPFAIKLQDLKLKGVGIGTISGRVFFFSTTGSIVGSFLAGFYLIPNFGIDENIIGISLFLITLGTLGMIKNNELKFLKRSLLIGILFLLINNYLLKTENNNVLFTTNGVYQKIYFVEWNYDNKRTKTLMLDANPSAARFYDSDELVFQYTKYYEIYKYFNKDASRFLFIGGGGYNMPYALADANPSVHIDVVEVEPDLYDIAKDQYNYQDVPNLVNHVQDGRVFLRTSDSYDMIVTDAYSALYSIPVHLTTLEFFELGYEKLNEKGVFIAYIVGKIDDSQQVFALSEYKTFSRVFPNNYVFAVDDPFSRKSQNILFVGYKSDEIIDFNDISIGRNNEIDLSKQLIDMDNFDLEDQILLTDNYAPVELLNAPMYDEIRI